MIEVRPDPGPPVRNLERALLACKFRDYNLEGIEMFLVLEDLLAADHCHSPPSSGQLSRLAEAYIERLVAKGKSTSLDDAANALEVLAAYHFDPVEEESLKTNMASFRGLMTGPLVRAVNFHNTPRARAGEVERWLLEAGEFFSIVGESDLDAMLDSSPGYIENPGKPPLIPVFYEGYRNHYEVALPMLERAGLRGWFFIPTAFIDTPVHEQYDFALRHYIGLTGEDSPGRRCAMSWDELREVVARGHVVASHTATHCSVFDLRVAEDARRELVESRVRLKEELGVEARILAWLLGTAFGEESQWVDALVHQAGYRLIFSGAKIQRLPRKSPLTSTGVAPPF